MSQQNGNPEYEIQMGEHGAMTRVGIKPPPPSQQLEQALEQVEAQEMPDSVSRVGSNGDPESYSLLEFRQRHFGIYRNDDAHKVIEALKIVLSRNGSTVQVDEEVQSLHGDNELFE